MVDLQLLKQLYEQLYVPKVVLEHGAEGELALRKIMEVLHKVYRHVSPETLTAPIVVFKTLDDEDRPLDTGSARTITEISLLPQAVHGAFGLQVLDNEQLLLWNDTTVEPAKLAQRAVVYEYKNRTEHFFAKTTRIPIQKVDPAYPSNFAIPTFSKLKDALEHYSATMVRQSSCGILSTIWADDKRVFVKNAQEWVMRDSLAQFLRCHLRGNLEVSVEQNVDTSHPVDVKVSWFMTNNLALIEVKWLGTPKFDDGHLGKPYLDARAREGAQQLAEYLDANKSRAPLHITRGYLVIIDLRRAKLKQNTTAVNRIDGLHYRDKEIAFDPKYHEMRDDFEVPIRMFVEPICT